MHRSRFTTALFATISVLGLAACDVDESLDPTLDQEFRTSRGLGCQGCNSPKVNDYPLDTVAMPNENHTYKLLSIRDPNGIDHVVDIAEEAFTVVVDGKPIKYDGLLEWDLIVDLDGSVVPIRIMNFDWIAPWAEGSGAVPAYALAFEKEYIGSDIWANICPEYDSEFNASVAVLVRDEIYPEEGELVEENPDMFSIACLGQAVSKMKLLGYGPNDHLPGWLQPAQTSTIEQRKSTLRMLTADYCGLGIHFTEQGTPLNWLNTAGTVVPQWGEPEEADLEALWDENGAICIGTPRLVSYEQVAYDCGWDNTPPPCEEEHFGMPHEWVTYRVP